MTFFANTAVRLGYHLLKWAGDDLSLSSLSRIRKILDHTRRLRRQELLHRVIKTTKGAVADGPFSGLIFSEKSRKTDAFIGAKLLGFYEREIQDLLAGWKNKSIDTIVTIGAGDGFFAMGSAHVLKPNKVWAVDTSETTLDECRENFGLNGLADKCDFQLAMNGPELATIARENPNLLIISDCEGFELELFNQDTVADMSKTHLIIECHDFVDRSISKTLTDLLSSSHDLTVITEGARDPNSAEVLRNLPSNDRWLVVSEDRPETMHWLIAVPRG